MVPILAFAFVAGILTILSPCTLPVVPLIVGAAAPHRSRRIGGLIVGFAGMFVAITVIFASALAAAGLSTDRLRVASAVLLGLVGATLAIPPLGRLVASRTARLAGLGHRFARRRPGDGFLGGTVLGAAIGLVWAPCVGPIMAAVIATAVASGPSVEALAIALVYVVGAAVPLALVALGGQRAIRVMGRPQHRGRLERAFGALMLTTALLITTGFDVPLQAAITDVLPAGWGGAIASVEQQPAVQEELDMLRTKPAAATPSGPATEGAVLPAPLASPLPGPVALEDLGQAPEPSGITDWINSSPITLASLRGRVVLVHFWTFGCINCIHVQPYVKAWYDRYGPTGFVVLGIHTPELSFERNIDNVREAVAKADVRFPVAFDPSFATWNAYRNSYWPAFYFVDRAGRIRHVHFGEGDYDGSEQVIRELLAEPG